MDRITKALLKEFMDEYDLILLHEDIGFEHFSGVLVTANHYAETFSSYAIHTGGGDDCGIDSLAIVVNGYMVEDIDEIEHLEKNNGYLDVTFVLVQSEKSSSFNTQKIGQFGFGVKDIFSESPQLPQNQFINSKVKIINEIFSKSSKFKNGNPQCFLYYVTTGRWTDDENLTIRRNAVCQEIERLSIFRKVEFECVDAEKIQLLYRNLRNSISREITFVNRTVLPDIPDIEQSYIGVLPVSEYLKLIENENGGMDTSIFYDNVRDWQEWNPVNLEIKNTLKTEGKSILFPLLNNGITIVAEKIHPTGNKFHIEDFQVVNGCQSSYVIHDSKHLLDDNILIPIRLIATDNIDVKNQIIKATNRQTEVSDNDLFALSDFPKKLESYFPTFEGSKKLYYERRSRQYNSMSGVEKVRIINMTTLVRAFASIFLELPHRTTRNYKSLLKLVGHDLFVKDHRLEMYYLSAFAHYRLEYLFRNQVLESKLKPARYLMLMAYRKIVDNRTLPNFNSNDMVRYCNAILQTLWNEEQYRNIFKQAADLILTVSNGNLDSDILRTEPFTEKINKEFESRLL